MLTKDRYDQIQPEKKKPKKRLRKVVKAKAQWTKSIEASSSSFELLFFPPAVTSPFHTVVLGYLKDPSFRLENRTIYTIGSEFKSSNTQLMRYLQSLDEKLILNKGYESFKNYLKNYAEKIVTIVFRNSGLLPFNLAALPEGGIIIEYRTPTKKRRIAIELNNDSNHAVVISSHEKEFEFVGDFTAEEIFEFSQLDLLKYLD
ncbi:hypothetical protein [Leptospira bandrabouensis]|uniref:Uncharacterized protein n=1 Tax=Leptospira bandrabouensis TaxID=2484903 RepID=A0A6H3NSC2_9LEPT|nr:hypothetical protein [Leptospira bandrabouensis]TGN13486.1 hypothetical protein EHR08_11560 [Leptospira bandrabouensis]